MFEFGALPPEINSGRMYAGPGSGPMLTAAAAWDAVADDLYLTAAAYRSAITDLTSSWLGPSSVSMVAAADNYVSWISATATHAQGTAAQAKGAAAAYEAAFAMTVPPAVIAANRALLMALIATNFFGQNTPAIMATEADYIEMWAQDAVAMYSYAGASSAASTLTPFTPPAPTTNSPAVAGVTSAAAQAAGTAAGTATQTVSSLSSAATPSALPALASAVTSSSSSSTATATSTSATSGALASGTSLVSGGASSATMLTSGVTTLGSSASLGKTFGSVGSAFGGGFPMFKSSLDIGAGAVGSPGSGGLAVSAVSGRAASLGALSVPQSWTSAAPAFSQVPSALPAGGGLPMTPSAATAGTPGPIGAPLANAAERGSAGSPLAARYNVRPAMVQRPAYAG